MSADSFRADFGLDAQSLSADEGSDQMVLLAQAAIEPPALEITAQSEFPAEVAPDAENVVRLPANVTFDEVRVNGADLVLVQADGSEIRIIGGALDIPTFVIGDVEVPQEVVVAVLEANDIDVAAGPDGTLAVAGQGPQGSGAGFVDGGSDSGDLGLSTLDLLGDTELGSEDGGEESLLEGGDNFALLALSLLDNKTVLETVDVPGGLDADPAPLTGAIPFFDTDFFQGSATVSGRTIASVQFNGGNGATSAQFEALLQAFNLDTPGGITSAPTGATPGFVGWTYAVGNALVDFLAAGEQIVLAFTVSISDGIATSISVVTITVIGTNDGPEFVAGIGDIDSAVLVEPASAGNPSEGVPSEDTPDAPDSSQTLAAEGRLSFVDVDVSDNAHAVVVGLTVEDGTTLSSLGQSDLQTMFSTSVNQTGANGVAGSVDWEFDAPAGAFDYMREGEVLTLRYLVVLSDGAGGVATRTVTITITGTNDLPRIDIPADTRTVDEDGLGGNQGDEYGDESDAAGIATSANGSLNIQWAEDDYNADGSVAVDLNFTGVSSSDFSVDAPLGTSRGETILFFISEDGSTITGYVGTADPVTGEPLEIVREVFVATLNTEADGGGWAFELLDVLDHPVGGTEDDILLNFQLAVVDTNGSTQSHSFAVTVNDDALKFTVGEIATGFVDEDGLPLGNRGDSYPASNPDGVAGDQSGHALQITGNLNISWGADDSDTADTTNTIPLVGVNIHRQDGVVLADSAPNDGMGRAVWFNSGAVVARDAAGEPLVLTSRGDAITYQLIESGTRLVAWADGRAVFTVSLSDDGTGSYRFTLLDQLDHPGLNVEDDIELTFDFTARDGDGDPISSSFQVRVNDDAPIADIDATGSLVRRDESANRQFEDSTSATVAARFNSVSVASRGTDPDMPAGYAVSGGLSPAAIATQAPGADRPVDARLSVAISGDTGEGVDSGLTTTDGTKIYLFLEKGVVVGRIADANGDADPAGLAAFAVTVHQATFLGQSAGYLNIAQWTSLGHGDSANHDDFVDLGGLIEIIHTVTDSDDDVAVATAQVGGQIRFYDSGPVASNYTGGIVSEGAGSQNLGSAVTVLGINPGADGFQGTLQDIAFTGGAGGTLIIDANGDLIFTPANVGPLGATETFSYTVTDGDGDSVTRQVTFNVTDTGVTNVSATNGLVDEDDLPLGNNDDAAGNDVPLSTGTINYTLGRDGLGSIVLSTTTINFTKLDGTVIETTWNGVDTLIGHGEGDQNDVVFTVKITSAGDAANAANQAAYEVTLLQPVRHEGSTPGHEDNVTLSVTATVTDGDGSVGTTNFNVEIDDDIPVVAALPAQVELRPIANTMEGDGNRLYQDANGDGGRDILLTGMAGGSAANVNLTEGGIHVGTGPGLAVGELLRLDFVRGLSVTGNPTPSFTGSEHYSTERVSFTVPFIQGSAATAVLFIQLFDVDANEDNTNATANFGDDPTVEIAGVVVSAGSPLVEAVHVGGVIVGYVVSGVPEGATVTVTGTEAFGRVTIQNYNGVSFDNGTSVVSRGGANNFGVDMPAAYQAVVVPLEVMHDETAGIQPGTGDTTAPLPLALSDAIAAEGLTELGRAASEGSVGILFDVSMGADRAGSVSFALVTAGGAAFSGEDSGLATVGGAGIRLYSEGDILWGVAGGNLETGTRVFAAHIGANGTLHIVQFAPIAHGDGGAAHDDVESTLPGLIHVALTARDADSDTASAVSNTPVQLSFRDDGPVAQAASSATSENNSISVQLDFAYGADGAGSILLGASTLNDARFDVSEVSISLNEATGIVTVVPGTVFDGLGSTETVTMTIPYIVRDGDGDTVTRAITVTITGSNDAASITVDAAVTDDRSVTEAGGVGNAIAGDPSASGKLLVSDVDSGEAAFQTPASLAGMFGTFTFNASTGDWTYTLTQGLADSLNAGDTETDTLTVTSLDGTATHSITVTITGSNDAASITVDAAVTDDRSVTEAGGVGNAIAGDPSASGKLLVSDVDSGEAAFQTPASLAGMFGTFTFNASTGDWTYTLTQGLADSLNAGDTETDTLTVTSLDGTATHSITVTITGSNDAASITVDAAVTDDRSVTEAGGVGNAIAGDPSASGKLLVSDVDSGEAAFQTPASLAGMFGTFTFNASTGDWTYTLTQGLADSLNAGDTETDTLTVTSLDGTATHSITVTITGSNDAAIISGDVLKTVVEDAAPNTVSGNLDSTDVDNADDAWVVANGSGSSGYGTFVVTAAGEWTYTLDNGNAAVDALNVGVTLTDTFTVATVDGTTQVVTITIQGSTDNAAPVANEDGPYALLNTQILTITTSVLANDVDSQPLTAELVSTTQNGVLVFNPDGTFTYDPTNTFVGVDTFTYRAFDGVLYSNPITVTIAVAAGSVVGNVIDFGSSQDSADFSTTAFNGNWTILMGGSQDRLTTAWDHGDGITSYYGDSTTAGGGNPNDYVNLVFTEAQIIEIISNAVFRTELQIFLDGTVQTGSNADRTLDLSASSWAATVFGFGNANISIAVLDQNGLTKSLVTYSEIGEDLPDYLAGLTGSNNATDNLLVGTSGNDVMHGGISTAANAPNGNDILSGGAGDDTLHGGGGSDLLLGGVGSDTLFGGDGNDILFGGEGDDRLFGGLGQNTLVGGTGADVFVIDPSALSGGLAMADLIADYTHGEDIIDLTALLTSLGAGAPGTPSSVDLVVSMTNDGTNTTLLVDSNGTTTGGTPAAVAVIAGVHTSITILYDGTNEVEVS